MKLSIPNRAGQCCKGHPFTEGAQIISELFKSEDGSWTRKDYCEACYEKHPDAYCTWHTSLHVKKTETSPLLELFREMQESDPKELYFLSEILLRQKQLVRRSRSKTEVMLEDAVTGELYAIPRFDLSLGEVRHFSMKYMGDLEDEPISRHIQVD